MPKKRAWLTSDRRRKLAELGVPADKMEEITYREAINILGLDNLRQAAQTIQAAADSLKVGDPVTYIRTKVRAV